MGSSSNWTNEYTTILGVEWSYRDALTGAILEGFTEAGPQLIFQLYLQMQTSWPALQPLFGDKQKAFYFESQKPGDFHTLTYTIKAYSSCIFFPEWDYVVMKFTWLDKVLSVTIVTSLFTILMASIEWHFIKQVTANELSLWRKVAVAPFFFSAIAMKTMVTSATASLLSELDVLIGPGAIIFCVLLTCQMTLQVAFRKKLSLRMIFANVSSVAQPAAEKGWDNTNPSRRYFAFETRFSIVFYGALAFLNIYCATIGKQDMKLAWICLGLVILHLLVSQAYLVTECGKNALYPRTNTPSKSLWTCLLKCFCVS